MKQRRALVYTEGRSICLQSWNDLADRYKIWSWGICGRTQAERKIKSGKNQAKKKKNFRDGHSLRGCSEKFLVVYSRTNQLRIKRHDHNVTGTHRVWNFANGSHWENVSSIPSLDPASFHSIFQMAIYFILLGKLLSVSLSPLLSLPATV